METLTLSAHNLYCIGKHVMGDKKGFLEHLLKGHQNEDKLKIALQQKPHLEYVIAGLMILDQQKRKEQKQPDKGHRYSFAAQLALILGMVNNAKDTNATALEEVRRFLKIDELKQEELTQEKVEAWMDQYADKALLPNDLEDLSNVDGGVMDYTYNLMTFVLDPQETLEKQEEVTMDLNPNDDHSG